MIVTAFGKYGIMATLWLKNHQSALFLILPIKMAGQYVFVHVVVFFLKHLSMMNKFRGAAAQISPKSLLPE
jgi:hypothetical protein